MKAVIMVAGVGSRLSKNVKHLPKCLLAFGGETILSRNVRLLKEHGIHEIVVVTGYRAALVKEEIQASRPVLLIRFSGSQTAWPRFGSPTSTPICMTIC